MRAGRDGKTMTFRVGAARRGIFFFGLRLAPAAGTDEGFTWRHERVTCLSFSVCSFFCLWPGKVVSEEK